MTDPTLNLTSPQGWDDQTPLDEIPAEHRARVADERAGAAAAPEAQETPPEPPVGDASDAARGGSRASTKARVNNPKPKTGAKARRKPEVEPTEPEGERVAVVLKTSRYTGRNGRAIARKRTVLVTIERGLKLVMLDDAREATEAEAAAARAAPVFLD